MTFNCMVTLAAREVYYYFFEGRKLHLMLDALVEISEDENVGKLVSESLHMASTFLKNLSVLSTQIFLIECLLDMVVLKF
ncbi:hypothetical protein ES332_D09G236500v1 [Gossypium tomentosum]|uniref:Uncharacterized protein n=1 Tax=Gossypium tomentosum TaxID=34277 RepID=A0A5D2JLY1_GOSTO|nr:hypothetical protein ES332_D09G236500v1 [Gossypium tomentosum]